MSSPELEVRVLRYVAEESPRVRAGLRPGEIAAVLVVSTGEIGATLRDLFTQGCLTGVARAEDGHVIVVSGLTERGWRRLRR